MEREARDTGGPKVEQEEKVTERVEGGGGEQGRGAGGAGGGQLSSRGTGPGSPRSSGFLLDRIW